MGHWNWINDIYNFEDACFQYFREQHKTRELEKMLKKELGDGCLWDSKGEYIIDLKDEYEGFKLKNYNDTDGIEKVSPKDQIEQLQAQLDEANELMKKWRDYFHLPQEVYDDMGEYKDKYKNNNG